MKHKCFLTCPAGRSTLYICSKYKETGVTIMSMTHNVATAYAFTYGYSYYYGYGYFGVAKCDVEARTPEA